MATISHFFYTFTDDGFEAGQTRSLGIGWLIGPSDWRQKAVVATAQPFDARGQNRRLSVTATDMRTTPQGSQIFLVTVRNTGEDTVFIYYLSVGVIAP